MNIRKSFIYIFYSLIAITLLKGCTAGADSENAVQIRGEVINVSNGNVIPDAIVEITNPSSLQGNTRSDEDGIFSFTVEVTEPTDVTVRASKTGFNASTQNLRISGGVDEDISIELTPASSGGGGGGGGGEQVGGEPAGAAAIVLTGTPNQAINIAETGDVVSTAFSFVVVDSAGRALDLDGAVDVDFSIIAGPGGGEEIIPSSARTNAQGQVTTSLFSGNAAGPVKVQASVTRSDIGLTIKSTPVLVAIHGGFPDPAHFSVTPGKYNFEGWDYDNVRNTINVIVGDKFSNPVKPGTVVYFSTTGGTIQGSGQTNDDGLVSVQLISGNPRPTDAITGSGGRDGYATITARTVDENDNFLDAQVNIVFSTSAASITTNPTTFDLAPNGGQSFTYTVTDLNGNPMAAGTDIAVEVGEGMEATGDVDFTLGNHLFPGPGATQFNFSIRDTDSDNSDPAPLDVIITVTSPSGERTSTTINGTRRKSW